MKLLIILFNYNGYIEYFNDKYSNYIKTNDYLTHLKLIQSDCFSMNGAWVKPFVSKGFEVNEIYYNNALLQKKWAKEFGKTNEHLSKKDLLNSQIEYYKPDFLFVDIKDELNSDWVSDTKQQFPFIKKIAGHICSPSFTIGAINKFDIVITCLESLQKIFKNNNINSVYLPHAFNSDVLNHMKKGNYKQHNKVLFSGSIATGPGFHNYRARVVNAILELGCLTIFSDLKHKSKFRDDFRNFTKVLFWFLIQLLKKLGFSKNNFSSYYFQRAWDWKKSDFATINRTIYQQSKDPVYGIDFFQSFVEYTAILNVHGDVAGNEAANLRLFEVTGAAGCLLTDKKENLLKFFSNDELVCFDDTPDALVKVKWLLQNPNKAKQIGLQAQRKVLSMHTYFQRVEKIIEMKLFEC